MRRRKIDRLIFRRLFCARPNATYSLYPLCVLNRQPKAFGRKINPSFPWVDTSATKHCFVFAVERRWCRVVEMDVVLQEWSVAGRGVGV